MGISVANKIHLRKLTKPFSLGGGGCHRREGERRRRVGERDIKKERGQERERERG